MTLFPQLGARHLGAPVKPTLAHYYWTDSLQDYSGYGNHGTMVAGLRSTRKRGRRCFEYTGTGYVQVADSASIRLGGGGTVIVFGDFSNQHSAALNMIYKWATVGNPGYRVWRFPDTDARVYLQMGATSVNVAVAQWATGRMFAFTWPNGTNPFPLYYVDGIYVGPFSSTCAGYNDTGNLIIGSNHFGTSANNVSYDGVLIYQIPLNANEIGEVWRWYLKQQSKRVWAVPRSYYAPLDTSDPDHLIVSPSFEHMTRGTYPDDVSAFDLTPYKSAGYASYPHSCRGIVGRGISVTSGSDTTGNGLRNTAFTGVTAYPFTMEVWAKASGAATMFYPLSFGVNAAATTTALQYNAGSSYFYAFSANPAVYNAVDLKDGLWHHWCGVAASATDRKLYIDGVFRDTDTTNVAYAAGPYLLDVGIVHFSGTNYFGNCEIDAPKIYNNSAFTAEQVRQAYLVGASKRTYDESFETVPINSAVITGLGNVVRGTHWRISDGVAQLNIRNDTTRKYLTFAAGGWLNKSIDLAMAGVTPTTCAAYGTWEFEFYGAAFTRFAFVSDRAATTTSYNGYSVEVAAGVITVHERTAAAGDTTHFTSNAVATAGAWHKLRITRDFTGEFYVFMDGEQLTAAGGTNPFTSTTFTTSTHMVLTGGVGEMVTNIWHSFCEFKPWER